MSWKIAFENEIFLARKMVNRVRTTCVLPLLSIRARLFARALARYLKKRRIEPPEFVSSSECTFFAVHGATLRIYVLGSTATPSAFPMASDKFELLFDCFKRKLLRSVLVVQRGGEVRADWLIELLTSRPEQAASWIMARGNSRSASTMWTDAHYSAALIELASRPELLDFFARGARDNSRTASNMLPLPFNEPDRLPERVAASPRRRSAVFLHNSYYHFNVLSDGLRRRGWDVLTVSLEPPDSPQQQFFHGQDLSLYDSDARSMRARTQEFFRTVPERFEALHFYGQYQSSFFPENYSAGQTVEALPWDFLELKRHNVLIGYMASGCMDGGLQSSVRALSGDVCSRCVWELRPDVCSDSRSGSWNRQLSSICDWIGLECDYATPERISPKSVYGPVVTALDPEHWYPDLVVPKERLIERDRNEILIFHAVGNYATRRANGRDIKGTGAAMAAIARLEAEGYRVRMMFIDKVPSREVKFLQVQADIVLDQLNYGRYGATAREAMMLGKPTICRLISQQAAPLVPLRPIVEAPLANASEADVYEVLRSLITDETARVALGRKAREFAVAWHGRDACAARYEAVIDRLRGGLSPDDACLYPATALNRAAQLEVFSPNLEQRFVQ